MRTCQHGLLAWQRRAVSGLGRGVLMSACATQPTASVAVKELYGSVQGAQLQQVTRSTAALCLPCICGALPFPTLHGAHPQAAQGVRRAEGPLYFKGLRGDHSGTFIGLGKGLACVLSASS